MALAAAAAVVLPVGPACLFTAAVLMVLAAVGSHRGRLTLSVLDDVPGLVIGVCVGAALMVATTVVTSGVQGDRADTAGGFAAVLGLAFLFVVTMRTLLYAVIRRRRRRGAGSPTLIVGSGEVAAFIGRVLSRRAEYGLAPVGFVSSGAATAPAADGGLPVLGTLERLESVVRLHGVRHLIVAFDRMRDSDMAARLLAWHAPQVRVLCVPRLYEVYPRAMSAGDVQGMPLVWVRRHAHLGVRSLAKRAVDVVAACVILLLAWPFMAVAAVLTRLEGRPPLFTQERVGRHGRRFILYKISSMTPDSPQEAATTWNINTDARLTRLGRLLRKSAVDELPQLFNVLRGDMSLVGPRPERPHFVAEFQERYRSYVHRHRVTVGLTGWSQIHGLRGDTPISERVLLDNYYIENWSLWLDAKIVLRTMTCLLRDIVS